MRKLLLGVVCMLISAMGFAQQGDGGTPRGFKFGANNKEIDTYQHPQPNIEALRAEDAINDKSGETFWRFGYHHHTNYTMTNSGAWISTPEGGKIWQLRIISQQALTINLLFNDVEIPEGCELFVYNPERTFVLGRFTQNHIVEGLLSSELIPGNSAIIEFYQAPNTQAGKLNIFAVSHGYRTAEEFTEKAFGGSGSCNMNVNCPDGTPWANQKRGALMLASSNASSSGFCSGSLINNTQNDGKPYVLTANHCMSSNAAGSTVGTFFRFNWEAVGCTNPGSAPTGQSVSGAIVRSKRVPSDFCLLEITGGLSNGTLPSNFNVYFNGWNNGSTPPTSTIGIHHPSGDIKKISFDDNPAVAATGMGSSEANSSWQVVWDRNTTTEGGSSGSPLFNQDGQIIGQLWGGGASCSALTSPDYYGRVFNSWQPAGSNSTNQLKYWLDPNNSGATSINGYDPNAVSYALDAQLSSIITPAAGASCNTSYTPQVVIRNNGTTTLTQLSVRYRLDNGPEVNFNWTGNLASNATANVTLASFTTTAGNHTFKVYTVSPNGSADQNNVNDTSNVSFQVLNPIAAALPFSESFEGTTFPPANWELQNTDNGSTWARTTTAASLGNASARKNNFDGNDAGQVDNLITPYLNFSGQNNVNLTFKVAYRRYSTTYVDSLVVLVSSNCGNTWSRVYNKGGNTLSTVTGDQTSSFTPTTAQWRLETVDLTSYAGQEKVQIMFQNKSGYGQVLYIDEINVSGNNAGTPPTPGFTMSNSTPCVNQNITLTNTSTNATSYSWNMPGATPSTSTDTNPNISFASAGSYTVTLTATNTNGSQQTQQTITVGACASIAENEAFAVTIFPNPTSDLVNVQLSETSGELQVKMTDMTGKTIQSQQIVANQFSIDISTYVQGIYLLTIQNEKGSVIRKIIKR